MENLAPIEPFVPGRAPAVAWSKWYRRFENYAEAIELRDTKNSDKRKVSVLMHVIGEEAMDVESTFTYTDGARNMESILIKLNEHYCPKKNKTFERQQFRQEMQGEGQTIDEYVTILKKLSQTCEYQGLTEELITDQIVTGIRDGIVKDRLIRTPDLDLQKALEICRAAELSKKQLKLFMTAEKQIEELTYKDGAASAVMAVNNDEKSNRRSIKDTKQSVWQRQPTNVCGYCGYTHQPRKCPAYGKQCLRCGKVGHFAKMCKKEREKVQQITETENSPDSELYFVGAVSSTQPTNIGSWKVKLITQGTLLTYKMDTGAQANVISRATVHKLKHKPEISRTSACLNTYTHQQIPLVGQCYLECIRQGKPVKLKFYITRDPYESVLGLRACTIDLNLVKCMLSINNMAHTSVETPQNIVDQYSDVFQGLGRVPGEYRIVLSPNAQPKIHAPRKVPFALMERLRTELDRMETEGVVVRVSKPTEWVNPMVLVQKPNGNLRICLDPHDLNAAILRPHYQLPTLETITSKLTSAKYFTVLDAATAFWQLQLTEASSNLCVFATPYGRYKFTRLPYGIKSAPEMFQQAITHMYEGQEGCELYMDDLLVWGATIEEHNECLRSVLQTARENGLKFQKSKLQLAEEEISYLGHRISKKGVTIDYQKVKAITEMPPPETKKELQRFLGMVTYLTRFIPNMATTCAPLRTLLQNDIAWHWYESHDQILKQLKKQLTNAPILRFFDVGETVEIMVDASPTGLGAVLLQGGCPVAYASATLTEAQKRYAHIEKELLAVTYGCQHFHQYTYGRPIVVYTDHKPLIAMATKPLAMLTQRIQRLFLRIQRYDMDLKYKPGKEMFIPDTLSRAPLIHNKYQTPDEDVQIQIILEQNEMEEDIDLRLEEVKEAVAADPSMQILQRTMLQGWPEHKKALPIEIWQYWPNQMKLQETNGMIVMDNRIVIPNSLQIEMLNRLHDTHQGIVNTKARARQIMYWPGMAAQIEKMISECATCCTYRNANPPEVQKPHHIPPGPWLKLAMDFFMLEGKNYIEIIDYYSKYIEVVPIETLQAKQTIPILKAIFARHGIPKEIISDGGPPFNGLEVKAFMNEWRIKHTLTSPRYPCSNGEVERAIQTIKKQFRKALHNSKDPYLTLLTLRTTPVMGSDVTPAQLLMGRRLATRLPQCQTLQTEHIDHTKYYEKVETNRAQRKHRTETRRILPTLQKNERIFVRKENRWQPGRVESKAGEPRSYWIKTDSGSTIRRNRRDLFVDKRPHQPVISTPDINSDSSSEEGPEEILRDKEVATEELPREITREEQTPLESPETEVRRTSKGRVVRAPIKFQDYEQY